MTERENLTTKVMSEILKEDADVTILFQCFGLSQYLNLFKEQSYFEEVLGEDGNAKVKKRFCKFADGLSFEEMQKLREELKCELYECFSNEDLSFLQGFKVFATYMYVTYNREFVNTRDLLGTKQITFAKYCWNKLMESTEDVDEIKKCCEMLMLL